MSEERDRLEQATKGLPELRFARPVYASDIRAVLSALKAAEAENAALRTEALRHAGECARHAANDRAVIAELKVEVQQAKESAAAEIEALRDDRERGLRIAHELTLETQTVEETCTSLVDLVRKARAERDRLRGLIVIALPKDVKPWRDLPSDVLIARLRLADEAEAIRAALASGEESR